MNNEKSTLYVINNSFKAIFRGKFATVSEVDGEFFYHTGNSHKSDHTLATIVEIAKANGLNVSTRASKNDAFEQLNAHLKTLPIDEVNSMTDTQIVEEIVEAGVAKGKTDDQMLAAIVNRGVSFRTAGKLFKSVLESKGYRITAKERAEAIGKILDGVLVPKDGDKKATLGNVQVVVDRIVGKGDIAGEVADTTDKQAFAVIRKYAKDNEIELPKGKKGGGGSSGSGSGIIKKVSDWMLENRKCTAEEIVAQIKATKPDITEGQLKKYVSLLRQMVEFGRKFASK